MLWLVFAYKLVWADVPFDKINFPIFDHQLKDFETKTSQSLKTVEQFFASDDGIVNGDKTITDMVLFVRLLAALLKVNENLLKPESDWIMEFNETINESDRDMAHMKFILIDSTLQTIRKKFLRLDEQIQPNSAIRKSNAIFIYSNLRTLLNYFDENDSIYKDYALDSAPLLINLALIVAVFTPLANTLIPTEPENIQLACKVKDLLVNYRTRAIFLRAQQLNSIDMHYKLVAAQLARPYDPMGYTDDKPATLHCNAGCSTSGYFAKKTCLVDRFGDGKYYFPYWTNRTHFNVVYECISEYAGLLRYRTEKMFPVELMDKLCTNPISRTPSGKIQ